MSEIAVKIEGLSKEYRLGAIGGTTLVAELQSKWAKICGKEDPNTSIGVDTGRYGQKFLALDNVNLEIHKGEAVGIIGHNGAGKSTLLKILSRVTAPTRGTAELHGRVSSMLEVGTGFHPELTGRENIYMNGAILGMTKNEVESKIEEIIDFSECRQFIDTPVKRYSSGMYVKLAFAVAAHLDAEIMIMDEVLAVGDVKFQKKCLGKMNGAAHVEGKTVLYVSHNMSTIRQLCTRCIVLDHGRIVFDGDVEKAIEAYADVGNIGLPVEYDLRDAKRSNDGYHGIKFRTEKLRFHKSDNATFSRGEKIKFDVLYNSLILNEEIGVYFTILSEDDNPVGTTFSNKTFSTSGEKNECICIELDASELVPGVYHFYLDFFNTNEFGAISSCDHPWQPIFFEIIDTGFSSDRVWNKNVYGSVELNSIEVNRM